MAITVTHRENENEASPAMFGDHELLSYAGGVDLGVVVFESLTGKVPTHAEAKIFNLILNLCFDHGPSSPSSSATIRAAQEGASMGEAVGAGVNQIGDTHGGAGEPLMEILYSVIKGRDVKDVVSEYLKKGKRMPGFGHRVYKDVDPRAQYIFKISRENQIGLEYIDATEKIRQEILVQNGKDLPINIDGAIAACFCGLQLEPKVAKAVFIVARSAGLCAHFLNNSK